MVFRKFLKNEQSYSKSTWPKLPLFFEDLKLFSWTFLSITNILAKIWKNSPKNNARDTKKFHLWHPAPQTKGSIRKGLSSFSMLPMDLDAEPHKCNFMVSRPYFLDEFFQILAKLFVMDKKVQLKSFRSSKNNGSVFQVFFL